MNLNKLMRLFTFLAVLILFSFSPISANDFFDDSPSSASDNFVQELFGGNSEQTYSYQSISITLTAKLPPGKLKADHDYPYLQIIVTDKRYGNDNPVGNPAKIYEVKANNGGPSDSYVFVFTDIKIFETDPAKMDFVTAKYFSNRFSYDFGDTVGIYPEKKYEAAINLTYGNKNQSASLRTSYYGILTAREEFASNRHLPSFENISAFSNGLASIYSTADSENQYNPEAVFIITQTDPYPFIPNPGNGDWGPTWVLFEDTEKGSVNNINLFKDNIKPFIPAPEGSDVKDWTYFWHDGIEIAEKKGVDIWLQIEPGLVKGKDDINSDNTPIEDLLIEVLDEFVGRNINKVHNNIIGIGIDAEWYRFAEPTADMAQTPEQLEPNQISPEDAKHWEELIKAYDPHMKLFFKHFANNSNYTWPDDKNTQKAKAWFDNYCPPDAYVSTIFINDSQDFGWDQWTASGNDPNPAHTLCFERMRDEFAKNWVSYYNCGVTYDKDNPVQQYRIQNFPKPRPLGFQFGYPGDLYLNDDNLATPAQHEPWIFGLWGELEFTAPVNYKTVTGMPITGYNTADTSLMHRFNKANYVRGVNPETPGISYSFIWVDFTAGHPYMWDDFYPPKQ